METNDTTKARLEHWKAAPEAMKAMLALEQTVRSAGIDPVQLEFIKLRASQINGCAYCMNMHFNDAVKAGVSAQRLHLLPVWREAAHLYTPAERAVIDVFNERMSTWLSDRFTIAPYVRPWLTPTSFEFSSTLSKTTMPS